MSIEAAVTERCYDIHGIGMSVAAGEGTVLEAVDLRFRDFRSETSLPSGELRFEFLTGRDSLAPPAGNRRAVYDTPDGSLYYFPGRDALYGEFAGVRLHCRAGEGVAFVQSELFTGRELYLATHPLATIALMELLERRWLFSLHAGCLATSQGGGVVLAGPSGAGKSTLALALTRAGLDFLSDDVVFLAHAPGGAVRALGFADAVGITEYTAERFPELQSLLDDPPAPGFPKRLRRIEDLFGATATSACTPSALVFPEVVRDQPSRIASLAVEEAMLRLIPDVLLTEPAATQAHLGAIAALLGQVRCYALRSGADLERAADLVREVL